MTRDEVLAAFDRIRVWQQGDRRAVHKPLLVLLALAAEQCDHALLRVPPGLSGAG